MRALLVCLLSIGCGARVEAPAGPVDTGVDSSEASLEFDLGLEPDTEPMVWDSTPPSSGDAARGDSADPGADWCPAAAPVAGSACTPSPLASFPGCTYGDSVVPDCRTRATCGTDVRGAWVWSVADRCWVDPRCPETTPKEGEPCLASGPCGYVDGTMCDCRGGLESTLRWACFSPPSAPCPKYLPNAGATCTSEGLACSYGTSAPCTWGQRVRCSAGHWGWSSDCKD